MKTFKNYFVPSLYQKYIEPGLPVTTLCEPMLTYMKSYAEIGGGPFNTGLVLSGTGIAPGTTITNAPNGGTWQYLPISKPLIGSVTSATLSSPGRFKLDGINFSDIDTSSSHCQGKLFTVSAYLNYEVTPFNTYQIVQTGDSFVLLSSSPGILSQADSSSFTINFCNSNDPYYVLMPGPGQ